MKTMPKEGSWVRLKSGRRHVAQVSAHMDQKYYPSGIRIDRPIEGFRYWNMEDVEQCAAPIDSTKPEER